MQGANFVSFVEVGVEDGRGMTLDNVNIYAFDNGGWEETTNGTSCECSYGYFYDGSDWNCKQCSVFSPLCLDCEYDNSSSANQFTCTDCPDGYYSQGAVCAPCNESIAGCSNCSIDGYECFECQTNYYFLNSTSSNSSESVNATNTTNNNSEVIC